MLVHRRFEIIIALVLDFRRRVFFAEHKMLVNFWATATIVEFGMENQRAIWIHGSGFKSSFITGNKNGVSSNCRTRRVFGSSNVDGCEAKREQQKNRQFFHDELDSWQIDVTRLRRAAALKSRHAELNFVSGKMLEASNEKARHKLRGGLLLGA